MAPPISEDQTPPSEERNIPINPSSSRNDESYPPSDDTESWVTSSISSSSTSSSRTSLRSSSVTCGTVYQAAPLQPRPKRSRTNACLVVNDRFYPCQECEDGGQVEVARKAHVLGPELRVFLPDCRHKTMLAVLREIWRAHLLQSCPPQPEWDLLPEVPLIKIYKYLSEKDRIPMSAVCRSWNRAFHVPEVWRSQRLCPDFRGCGLARRFGRHVRDLRVSCLPPWTYTSFKRFLRSYRGAHLRTLRVIHLGLGMLANARKTKSIVKLWMEFFRGQRYLHHVTITDAWLRAPDAKGMMGALPASVSFLNVEGLMSPEIIDLSSAATIADIWGDFILRPNLSQLMVGCDFVTEGNMERLAVSPLARGLQVLGISLMHDSPFLDRVRSHTWRALTVLNPHLQVHLVVENATMDLFARLAVARAPVKKLRLHYGKYHASPEESRTANMEAVFNVITALTCLETLEIYDNTSMDMEIPIEVVLRRCTWLKNLRIAGHFSSRFLQNVAKLRASKELSLKQLHVTLRGLPDDVPGLITLLNEVKETPRDSMDFKVTPSPSLVQFLQYWKQFASKFPFQLKPGTKLPRIPLSRRGGSGNSGQ